jgi:hypothetical protein
LFSKVSTRHLFNHKYFELNTDLEEVSMKGDSKPVLEIEYCELLEYNEREGELKHTRQELECFTLLSVKSLRNQMFREEDQSMFVSDLTDNSF